jgi:hypothetical protein
MCWLQAVPITSLTLVADASKKLEGCGWHRGIVGRRRPDTSRAKGLQTRLEKLTRIALAGSAAQRRFKPKTCRSQQSASDREAAVGLISHLCQSEREVNARLHLHQIEVEQALHTQWHVVEAVARALLEKKSMIGWEVETIIGAAYKGLRSAFELEKVLLGVCPF